MDKIDAKLPSPSLLAATNHLSRAETSVLMQLRTGHIPLNAFLHRISQADSPTHPTCQHTDETIHHYLFDCPGHTQARHSLGRAMGQNSKSIQHLLGNWQSYKSVLKYVRTTGRFKNIYGDLPTRPAPDGAPPPNPASPQPHNPVGDYRAPHLQDRAHPSCNCWPLANATPHFSWIVHAASAACTYEVRNPKTISWNFG